MVNEDCGGKQQGDESTNSDTCQAKNQVQHSTLEVDYDVGCGDNNDNPMLSPMTIDSHSTLDPSSCVQVAVRVRPLLALEGDDECCVQVLYNGTKGPTNSIQIGGSSGPQYTFDQVFDMETTQVQVYESRVAPLIESCLDGYNATILAYGQTGSGVSSRYFFDFLKLLLE
jgi:Kinesin motor domain